MSSFLKLAIGDGFAYTSPTIKINYMLEAKKMLCPKCGGEMNHHADKLNTTATLTEPDALDPDFGGIIEEIYTCANCKNIEIRNS